MNTTPWAALAVACALLASGSAQADANLDISMAMRKDVRLSDNSAVYRIQFNLEGDSLKSARRVVIAIPNGKKMEVQNPLHLNIMKFEVAEPDYQRLVKSFPEGQYKLRAKSSPRNVFLSHDFPAGLAVISPATGSAVPTSFSAQWYPVANAVSSIFVEITGPGRSYVATLPATATSFTVPDGLLEPNQAYTMALGVSVQGDSAGRHETAQIMEFTTEP
jgi:hypothetical protein